MVQNSLILASMYCPRLWPNNMRIPWFKKKKFAYTQHNNFPFCALYHCTAQKEQQKDNTIKGSDDVYMVR